MAAFGRSHPRKGLTLKTCSVPIFWSRILQNTFKKLAVLIHAAALFGPQDRTLSCSVRLTFRFFGRVDCDSLIAKMRPDGYEMLSLRCA